LILNKDIILNEIVVDNFEYCQHCGSDQMPMADDSCRDCGKPFLPPNH
jgi:predicted amidophosphoribosyltransferase